MIRAWVVVIGGLLVFTSPTLSAAQSFEMSALAGYTLPVEFSDHAPEIDKAGIGGGATMSFQGAWFFTPRWGVEGSWSQQFTAYEIGAGGETLDVHRMSIGRMHGNVVYQFGAADARVQPYVFGGIGSAIFSARDLETEYKLSLALGTGIKYFRWPGIGLVGRVRYTPTMMNDTESADFCDPFGYCQSTLQQIDFLGGVVFRF